METLFLLLEVYLTFSKNLLLLLDILWTARLCPLNTTKFTWLKLTLNGMVLGGGPLGGN